MDAAVFEQVYGAFQDFHAYFAPLFGRREARDHSRHYLQALLVQSGERRNAENLSETVPASARVMQRFLAESPWDDDTVIGRLQEYLGPRIGHPEAVWVLDGSDFPKQGRKSVGVARQYCGRLGKVASCQAGMFLAYVSPPSWIRTASNREPCHTRYSLSRSLPKVDGEAFGHSVIPFAEIALGFWRPGVRSAGSRGGERPAPLEDLQGRFPGCTPIAAMHPTLQVGVVFSFDAELEVRIGDWPSTPATGSSASNCISLATSH